MGHRTLTLGILATAVAALTAACAPRDVGPEPGFDGWVNELGQVCYPNSIGSVQIRQLFYQAAFIDLASRLYYGKITPDQFRGMVQTFYPGDNKAAVDCIISRLPKKPTAG